MSVGRTPTTFNDRQLAGKVRDLALNQILEILEDKSEANSVNRLQFLQKLAPNLLPRLQEVTGADGGPVQIEGIELGFRE